MDLQVRQGAPWPILSAGDLRAFKDARVFEIHENTQQDVERKWDKYCLLAFVTIRDVTE